MLRRLTICFWAALLCSCSGANGSQDAAKTPKTPVQSPVTTLEADKGPWIVNKRVLLVSLEDLRARVQRMERWLRANPGHPQTAAAVRRIEFYMHVYVTPDQWCKKGRHCDAVLGQRQASYAKYVEQHAGSRWEGQVASALRQMRRGAGSGGVAAGQARIDAAYLEAAGQMMSWYRARGDVGAQKKVGTEHLAWRKAWLQAYDQLKETLSPQERKQLDGYHQSKLQPVFGRFDVLLARIKEP